MLIYSIEIVILVNNINIPQILCFLTYNFVHKKHQVNTENWTQLNQAT